MTTLDLLNIFRKTPPVDVLLGIVVQASGGVVASEEWFTLCAQGGALPSTGHTPVDEKLLLILPSVFLEHVAAEGIPAVLQGAERLKFTIDGDFRIYLYYIREVVQLISSVATERYNPHS